MTWEASRSNINWIVGHHQPLSRWEEERAGHNKDVRQSYGKGRNRSRAGWPLCGAGWGSHDGLQNVRGWWNAQDERNSHLPAIPLMIFTFQSMIVSIERNGLVGLVYCDLNLLHYKNVVGLYDDSSNPESERTQKHTKHFEQQGFTMCWLSQDGRLECSLFILKSERKSGQFSFVVVPICCARQKSPAEGGASQYLLCPLVWFGSGKISFESNQTFIYWWYSCSMIT